MKVSDKKIDTVLRHEEKYFLSFAQMQVIKSRLDATLQLDKHSHPDKGYTISSIYFDSLSHKNVFEKLSGIRDRHKYRVRFYNNELKGSIKLEKKIKVNEYVSKKSVQLDYQTAEGIILNDFFASKNKTLLEEFLIEKKLKLLKPVVLVEYDRLAYISPLQNTRVTFDLNLRFSSIQKELGLNSINDLKKISAYPDSRVIMEIKYNSFFPEYLRSIIGSIRTSRRAISKYVTCMATSSKNNWEDHIYGQYY